MKIIIALIVTILIEFFIYSLFLRKNYLKLLGYSILINGLTNPLANLIFNMAGLVLLIEILVFVVEIFLIKYLFRIKYLKAILISFIANLISFLIGFFIFSIY